MPIIIFIELYLNKYTNKAVKTVNNQSKDLMIYQGILTK
jgi:hypothetical protein